MFYAAHTSTPPTLPELTTTTTTTTDAYNNDTNTAKDPENTPSRWL